MLLDGGDPKLKFPKLQWLDLTTIEDDTNPLGDEEMAAFLENFVRKHKGKKSYSCVDVRVASPELMVWIEQTIGESVGVSPQSVRVCRPLTPCRARRRAARGEKRNGEMACGGGKGPFGSKVRSLRVKCRLAASLVCEVGFDCCRMRVHA